MIPKYEIGQVVYRVHWAIPVESKSIMIAKGTITKFQMNSTRIDYCIDFGSWTEESFVCANGEDAVKLSNKLLGITS